MDSLKKSVLAASLAAFVSIGSAQAADIPIIEPAPPLEFGSAWYLRGDIGYKAYNVDSIRYGDVTTSIPFINPDADSTWLIGAGFGYVFNNYLRADLTFDYEGKADLTGNTVCVAVACAGALTSESASLLVITILANLYVDLGSWYGISPYVGVGVGMALLDLDDHVSINPAPFPNTIIGGNSEWNFAAAAMLGVSYSFTDNLLLDVNYRHLWLGGVSTAADILGNQVHYEDITAHEFRVGVRWLID